MMPPHLTSSPVPEDGRLDGDVLELHGYTLSATSTDDLTVEDVLTGEAVPFTTELTNTRIDRSGGAADPMPGSIQQRSLLRVTMAGLVPGRSYRLTFLDDVFVFERA